MHPTRILLMIMALALVAACGGREAPYGGRPIPPPLKPDTTGESVPKRTVPAETGKIAGRQVGGSVATFMTSADRTMLEKATQKALETGTSGNPVQWLNSASGNRGSITPQPRFDIGGKNCREFHQTMIAGDSTATGYGTACRDNDGTWRIAEDG